MVSVRSVVISSVMHGDILGMISIVRPFCEEVSYSVFVEVYQYILELLI